MQTARAACSSNSSPSRARRAEEHPGDRGPEAPEGERQNGGRALSARGPPPDLPGRGALARTKGREGASDPPPQPGLASACVTSSACAVSRGAAGAGPGPASGSRESPCAGRWAPPCRSRSLRAARRGGRHFREQPPRPEPGPSPGLGTARHGRAAPSPPAAPRLAERRRPLAPRPPAEGSRSLGPIPHRQRSQRRNREPPPPGPGRPNQDRICPRRR